jgi:hypothetical protein
MVIADCEDDDKGAHKGVASLKKAA